VTSVAKKTFYECINIVRTQRGRSIPSVPTVVDFDIMENGMNDGELS
jgi:hypothetical protein